MDMYVQDVGLAGTPHANGANGAGGHVNRLVPGAHWGKALGDGVVLFV